MVTRLFIIPLLFVIASVGCASIMKNGSQTVFIDSEPRNAQCTISQDREIFSRSTPFTMSVDRDSDDLVLSCKKEGYHHATQASESESNGWAWGNLILGGLIGLGVDIYTGRMWDYPSNIFINLGEDESINKNNKFTFSEVSKEIRVVKIEKNRALIVLSDPLQVTINQTVFIKKLELDFDRIPSSGSGIIPMRIKKQKGNNALVTFKNGANITKGKYILCHSKSLCE